MEWRHKRGVRMSGEFHCPVCTVVEGRASARQEVFARTVSSQVSVIEVEPWYRQDEFDGSVTNVVGLIHSIGDGIEAVRAVHDFGLVKIADGDEKRVDLCEYDAKFPN
jgi:hypothetical protein